MSTSYGFIGLGAMGYPMATTLIQKLNAQDSLAVFDVSAKTLERFQSEHASTAATLKLCSSAREVTEHSNVIISMVPEGKHVDSVFFGEQGVCSASTYESKLFIDCSTIDVATSAKVAQALQRKSLFCDAPCSGGPAKAANGTLTFMAGIAETDEHWDQVMGVLSRMGTNIFACGGPQKGLATKLANNYLSGLIAIATSEAMSIGQAHGLDPHVLSNVFNASTASNWINANCNPVPGVSPAAPPSKGYVGGFKVQLMLKDFTLAMEAAKSKDVNVVLGEKGLQTYKEASSDPRYVDRDSRVVYKFLRQEDI